MRILLVCDGYPPVVGGSEIEAQRVASALIARGHSVRVLTMGGPPMPAVREWVDPFGVPVSILTRSSKGRPRDVAFAVRVAREILADRKLFDVVYFLMQGLHLATGLVCARFLRKPAVVKIAGSGVIGAMLRTRAGRFELDCMKRWGIPLMVLNDGMVGEALAAGFARGRLVWMPNPVDTGLFRPGEAAEVEKLRARYGVPPQAVAAVYVGRLAPEKGLRPLIRGFAAASRTSPHAYLLVVGDGPMRGDLEALAADSGLGPDKIRFAGRVPVDEVPDALRATDVFALTSPSEGFSCALLEAMSAGLPSVVSAIPANLQLIDEGVQGLTVAWDDEAAIGTAFTRLFHDADLRRTMGRAARARAVENYSTEKVVTRYERLFAETVERVRYI